MTEGSRAPQPASMLQASYAGQAGRATVCDTGTELFLHHRVRTEFIFHKAIQWTNHVMCVCYECGYAYITVQHISVCLYCECVRTLADMRLHVVINTHTYVRTYVHTSRLCCMCGLGPRVTGREYECAPICPL